MKERTMSNRVGTFSKLRRRYLVVTEMPPADLKLSCPVFIEAVSFSTDCHNTGAVTPEMKSFQFLPVTSGHPAHQLINPPLITQTTHLLQQSSANSHIWTTFYLLSF